MIRTAARTGGDPGDSGDAGGSGGARFASVDPRTGEIVGTHPVHGAAEVAAAVERARAASGWWAGLGFAGRAERLRAFNRLLGRRTGDLALLISAETGKSADDARLEVAQALAHLDWAGHNAERVLGRRRVRPGLPMINQVATVEHRPYGVIGVIGPWNNPAATPLAAVGAALAAGNTVVVKPSEFTPGVVTWLAAALAEAVPEEPVCTVVTGYGETGAALCAAGVDKIAFTGSAATARLVLAACATTLTPAVVACGGANALVVAEDADLDAAADAAVWGALANAGQSAAGFERAYVVDAVADAFTEKVAARMRGLRPGGQAGAAFGPITTPARVDVVRGHVLDALTSGGRALVGGTDSVRPPYVEPVLLVDVPEDAAALTEETFGPVLVVNRVPDADTGIERANAGRYALGATVYARSRAQELADALTAGVVSINSVLTAPAVPGVPFGGSGESGFGRVHGDEGLREFARSRTTTRLRFRLPWNPFTFARRPRTTRRFLAMTRRRYTR